MKTSVVILVVVCLSSTALMADEKGPNWVRVTEQAGWQPRDSQGEVVYSGRLWIFGGWFQSFEAPPRDVWSSSDGKTWNLNAKEATWKHSDLPMSIVFDDKMWMMGGWYNGRLPGHSASNEVWWSTDGANWEQATANAGWSPRIAAAVVDFKGKMWLLGGTENYYFGDEKSLKNDVWSSGDGKEWKLVTANAGWSPRAYHQAVVLNDKIYVFGGGNYVPQYHAVNDVWCSDDGIRWTQVTDAAPWAPRLWFSSAVYRDRMWVLGGWSNNPSKNWGDVWHSNDGKNWTELKSQVIWKERHEHSAFVFKDKLWIAGGHAQPLSSEVWSLEIPPSAFKGEQVTDSTQGNPTPRLPRDNLLVYRGEKNDLLPVRNTSDWLKRRAEIIAGMQSVMGRLPGREKRCPLDMKVEEEVDCGSYVRRLITYSSEPGSRVPAYLCIPKAVLEGGGKRAPGVLCLHGTDNVVGHGVVVGLGGKANRQYASELAERGYVTLAPNYPLLAKYQPNIQALDWESGTLKAVWDNMRGFDLLESLPFVKPGLFGTIGHSLGGHNSVYTAVFDDRIQAVVSSCGLDSFLDYYGGDEKVWFPQKGWCQTRYMLRLADYRGRLADIPFDFHELVGALAPRHVLIVAPLRDGNFKADSVDRVAAAASQIYELYGQPTRLRIEHPDCEHDFPTDMREKAYELFDAVLR